MFFIFPAHGSQQLFFLCLRQKSPTREKTSSDLLPKNLI